MKLETIFMFMFCAILFTMFTVAHMWGVVILSCLASAVGYFLIRKMLAKRGIYDSALAKTLGIALTFLVFWKFILGLVVVIGLIVYYVRSWRTREE
jgi:hypothetical protein